MGVECSWRGVQKSKEGNVVQIWMWGLMHIGEGSRPDRGEMANTTDPRCRSEVSARDNKFSSFPRAVC